MEEAGRYHKIRWIFILTAILCTMGCSSMKSEFSGNSTANDEQFLLDFKVLNTTKSNTMPLKKGDRMKTSIQKDEGKIAILVKSDKGTVVYRGDDVSSSHFEIEIQEEGTYTFSVTGNGAKGEVSFKKITTGSSE